MTSSLDDLRQLLAERSAQRGRFTLSSGRESTLYIDARLTTMSPEGLVLIGQLGFQSLQLARWDVHAVGGLTLGADPVAYAIAYTSANTRSPIRAFTVRKEPKTHGTGRLLEGPILPSDSVVVVEDVITTGASALRAISAIRAFGARVRGVLAIVDREEGGKEALEAQGLEVIVLINASEIIQRMS